MRASHAALIASSQYYYRQAAGIHSANGVRIQVSGIDLIRDEHGEMRVLEDNVRVPSGVSYVISNRRVMAQTLRISNAVIAYLIMLLFQVKFFEVEEITLL